MSPRISILTPTRRRPDNVRRLIESARQTAHGEFEFIFYVDDDDPTRDQIETLNSSEIAVITMDRCVLSEAWNRCAEIATADILMQCGDDIVFRSPGWDVLVVNEFDTVADKILFVHGRDGIQDDHLGTHGFLHRRWMETVEYFVPPLFASDYNDLWLTEVADALGRRRYLPDVYTEHMHPVAGKAQLDVTHQERLARHQAEDCDAIWRNTQERRNEDVAKLRQVITNYQMENSNV